MRYEEGESYESWANRVRLYEHGDALKRLAAGDDPNEVLERMSIRIAEKMLFPIVQAIKSAAPLTSQEEFEKSKKHYEEIYIKKIPKRHDQMDGTFFDKDK